MTVNANDGQISITATGGETTLNFDFLIYASSDLLVRKRATDGTLTTLAITTDYTVPGGSINNPAGGTINLVVAATAGEVYTLASDVAESRAADFQQAGDLKASTLNADLDKLTRISQQLRRDIDAAVRIPTGGVNIDAGGVKVVNLGSATEPTDAVTLADAQALIAASGNVPAPLVTQIGSLLEATGTGTFAWRGGTSNVASASTVDLAATTTRRVVISGTTTITSFGVPTTSGQFRFIRFTDALILTHNATLLHLPGGANIPAAAEDRAIFISRGGSGWECYAYVKANGKPIIANLPTELGSMNAGRLLGRLPGSGSGSPQELTLGAGAAGLLDDADAEAMRTTIDAAQRMTLLASGNLTGATVNITNIAATYSQLFLYIDGASHDSGVAREIQVRFSTNNGSSYSSTATDYRGIKIVGAATPAQKARATLVEFGTAAAAAHMTGHVLITAYRSAVNARFQSFLNDGTTMAIAEGQLANAGVAINALQFLLDGAGNYDGGTYALYGIA